MWGVRQCHRHQGEAAARALACIVVLAQRARRVALPPPGRTLGAPHVHGAMHVHGPTHVVAHAWWHVHGAVPACPSSSRPRAMHRPAAIKFQGFKLDCLVDEAISHFDHTYARRTPEELRIRAEGSFAISCHSHGSDRT